MSMNRVSDNTEESVSVLLVVIMTFWQSKKMCILLEMSTKVYRGEIIWIWDLFKMLQKQPQLKRGIGETSIDKSYSILSSDASYIGCHYNILLLFMFELFIIINVNYMLQCIKMCLSSGGDCG